MNVLSRNMIPSSDHSGSVFLLSDNDFITAHSSERVGSMQLGSFSKQEFNCPFVFPCKNHKVTNVIHFILSMYYTVAMTVLLKDKFDF